MESVHSFPAQESETHEKDPEDKLPCSKDPALPVKIQCTKKARHKPCVGKRLTDLDSTLPILHLKTTGALSARGGRTAGDGTACALSCVAEGTLHHPIC